VNSENKLQNGGDFIDGDLDISDEEKYLPGLLNHQQKNMEPSIELQYENMDRNSENIITATPENSEEITTKDSGRLTDDELGFDPFHETQKALAEMMEKESMMLMMQDQQNKQQHPHGFLSQAHLHNQHSTMSHLSHHLYQQYQLNQVNHFSHQVPHASVFGGSKLLGSFTSHNQQHIMPQQNHRFVCLFVCFHITLCLAC
jgi:CCR4-NOT transcription complex subunit 4